MAGDFGYFQDLFPNLAARGQAKRAQNYEDRRHTQATVRQHYANTTAVLQQSNAVAANARQNKKISENFFKSVEADRLNRAAQDNAKTVADVERKSGQEAAAGFALVEQAGRGVAGTGLADQINAAQAFRISQVEGLAADQAKAARFNQVGSVAGAVNAAFSQVATGVPLVALDYSQQKRQEFKTRSLGKSILKDVGRLVATYYGGTMARDAIDAHNGYEEKYQAREGAVQGALDSLYGAGVVQNKTQNRPQFSAIVAGARKGDYSQGVTDAFKNQKQGNNAGITGQQWGQMFDGLSNLLAKKPKGKIKGSLKFGDRNFQGLDIPGSSGGGSSGGGSSEGGGGFDFSQFKNFNWGSFFGG